MGDATEIPGGGQDLLEDGVLEHTYGAEAAAEVFLEFGKGAGLVGRDEDGRGGESVADRVLRGSGFSGGGFGSSGAGGVAFVCSELFV